MKKTLLATAIAASVVSSMAAQADIAVTNMVFGPTYGITGTLLSSGGGPLQSTGYFFGHSFPVTQATPIMDNTGSWAGTDVYGDMFDYTADISLMTSDQRAVGMYFNWHEDGIPVLEIFNCNDDGSGDVCSGTGVTMQAGGFAGSTMVFNGIEVSVPIPAAAWLLGSGLTGLIAVAPGDDGTGPDNASFHDG